MAVFPTTRSGARWLSMAAGVGAVAYATYAGLTWLRYGHASQPAADDEDLLVIEDRFEIETGFEERVGRDEEVDFEIEKRADAAELEFLFDVDIDGRGP